MSKSNIEDQSLCTICILYYIYINKKKYQITKIIYTKRKTFEYNIRHPMSNNIIHLFQKNITTTTTNITPICQNNKNKNEWKRI